MASFQHQFVPDDEGLFCVFCGRTAGEHGRGGDDGDDAARALSLHRSQDNALHASVEEEDDWDAIQVQLKKLTVRVREESQAREKAEQLLNEMKSAFEKLREDVGQIRTWGSNADSQLGHYGGKPSLVEIRGVLRQVSCGGSHTAALTDDGQLYIWGRGNEGQLGLGDYRPRTVPAIVKSLGDQTMGTTVIQVACGGAHTLALCDNGSVYAWGSNDEMQLGLGATFGRKVNRPEVVAELSNKGVLRVAAGKAFSLALTESGDVYSWGAGGALQLGHGSKLNEERPRHVESLREIRKLGSGAAADHAAAISAFGDDDGAEEEEMDELFEAEDQLDKARSRREDAMRAMRADLDALQRQLNQLDARLAGASAADGEASRLHALRESIQGEISELEILITGKHQLEESMALLNKHKTNDFRTSMLMKWSRPGARAAGEQVVGAGGFTPRTMARKQAELKEMQQEKKMTTSELRDIDDQLEQIELEKTRLGDAVDEDADITEALDELREQLAASKKEKLAQMNRLEQAERGLAAELGVATEPLGGGGNEGGGGGFGSGGGGSGMSQGRGGGGVGLDAGSAVFMRSIEGLWRRLEASSIEKLNVGQQEALGVKDLLKLSNEQIDAVAAEVKRTAATKRADALDTELTSLLYDLIMDACSARKRLNDYTEGLLVQTAQKLDLFKSQYHAARA